MTRPGKVSPAHELGVVIGWVDQRDRQDAHEAAVALVVRIGRAAGVDGRNAGPQPMQRRGGGAADVEGAVAIGRVGALVPPRQRPASLVFGVEADASERVEQGEHERPIVTPGARRLVVRAMAAELDALDVMAELVGHADRVAHQMAEDGRARLAD